MTRFNVGFVFFITLAFNSFSQTNSWPRDYVFSFTDKSNTPFNLDNPEAFLSSRSIERRIRQKISIIVQDLPVDPGYLDQIRNLGGKVKNRSRWLNSAVVEVPDSVSLDSIRSLPFIVSDTRVQKHEPLKTTIDKKLETVAGGSNHPAGYTTDYGASFNQVDMLGGVDMHHYGYRGEGKVIAVIDAGFFKVNEFSSFDSLLDEGKILATYDFVMNERTVYEDHSHGMSVLSTMGGNHPGKLIGTAPEASFILLRSENASTEYLIEEENWISAAEYADSAGADIINTSLGYTTFDDPSQNHTYADLDGSSVRMSIAASIAASKGMLVVNSAGNSGVNSWRFIGVPADAFDILTVGSVDSLGKYSSFSSVGPAADGRIKPEVSAMGSSTLVQIGNGNFALSNGTSYSSPLIAGMAACLWQAHPDLTSAELRQAIIESASKYSTPDFFVGYGIPNFFNAHIKLSGFDARIFNSDSVIALYPNPVSGDYLDLKVFTETQKTIKIRIFDIRGRVVYDQESESKKIFLNKIRVNNLSSLDQGVYLIRIDLGDKIISQKLIRN